MNGSVGGRASELGLVNSFCRQLGKLREILNMQLVGANPGEPSACRVVGSLRNKASLMQSEVSILVKVTGPRSLTDYKTNLGLVLRLRLSLSFPQLPLLNRRSSP